MSGERPTTDDTHVFSKVPAATLAFWIVKIFATTVGETGGDALSMTLNLGYVVRFTPFAGSILFWAAYVLTRPLGATLGDTLTKPVSQGGLNFGRITSSLVIAGGMVIFIASTSLRKRASELDDHAAGLPDRKPASGG